MTRKALLALCAGLPLAASAHALPPILDRVPADAMVVVTLPSVQQLDKDVMALSAAAKLPVPAMMGVEQMLQMQGLDQVIDPTRPGAVFIKGWTDVEEEPPYVALIPVKDYQQLVQMFMAEEQNGIHALDLSGQKMFARPAGEGYAAIGSTLQEVQQYEGGAGNAAAFKQALGPTAEKVVDSSMLAVIVNAETTRELMDQFITTVQEDMAMNMGGMQMPDSPAADWLRATISRDAQMYVSGVSGGAKGASLDMVVRFKPDSYMAKAVTGGGQAGTYLSRLPKQPYIVAFAMDLSSPGMRTFIKDLGEKARQDAAQAAPNMLMERVEQINGFSYMIGAPVAIMVPGGLFANALAYVATDDAAAYIEAVQTTMGSLDGETANGLVYDTEWTENATTVGDTKAHAWTLRMTDDGTNPMAGQMQMLFGPGGLSGYIAPANGGVVQTYAQNSMILGAALDTAKGNQQGLSTDPMTGRVSETLPTGRIIEGYLGAQSIYQMIAPFLGAMGGGQPPKAPGELPPVGFAVAAGQGEAHARLFIPAPVIEAGAAIGMSLQGPQNFDEEELDESGQPGF